MHFFTRATPINDIDGKGYTVKPLLKDTPNKGHNTFNLSIMDKFYVPIGPWQYNFTSERGQPLYNSKIRPKIVGPQVSVI